MLTSKGIRHEALTDRQGRHRRTLKNWTRAGLDDSEGARYEKGGKSKRGREHYGWDVFGWLLYTVVERQHIATVMII